MRRTKTLRTSRFGGLSGPKRVRQLDSSRANSSGQRLNKAERSARIKANQVTRLIFCEGYEDELFLRLLLKEFGLVGFDVIAAEGNSLIGEKMLGYQTTHSTNWERAKTVLIVADNDDDPANAFKLICRQIDNVFGPNSAPAAPKIVGNTQPPCAVLMLPDTNEHGCLESLCCHAAKEAAKTIGNTTTVFLDLLHSDRWHSQKRHGKAWLRANLAARCAEDPFIPLKAVFRKPKFRKLIPIASTNPALRKLATAISSLTSS
jgi:hypothetical protein